MNSNTSCRGFGVNELSSISSTLNAPTTPGESHFGLLMGNCSHRKRIFKVADIQKAASWFAMGWKYHTSSHLPRVSYVDEGCGMPSCLA